MVFYSGENAGQAILMFGPKDGRTAMLGHPDQQEIRVPIGSRADLLSMRTATAKDGYVTYTRHAAFDNEFLPVFVCESETAYPDHTVEMILCRLVRAYCELTYQKESKVEVAEDD